MDFYELSLCHAKSYDHYYLPDSSNSTLDVLSDLMKYGRTSL